MDQDCVSEEKIRKQIQKTLSKVNELNKEDSQVVFVTQEGELDSLDFEDDDVVLYLSIKMKLNDVKTPEIIEPSSCNMKLTVNSSNGCNRSQGLAKQNTLSPEKKETHISKKSITNGPYMETKNSQFEDPDSLSGSSTDSDDSELDFSSLRYKILKILEYF